MESWPEEGSELGMVAASCGYWLGVVERVDSRAVSSTDYVVFERMPGDVSRNARRSTSAINAVRQWLTGGPLTKDLLYLITASAAAMLHPHVELLI